MGATILLLQDAAYFPSYGGGNKANRLLLAALAARGFDCHAVSRMPAAGRVLSDRFSAEALAARGIEVETGPRSMSYRHDGVSVEALDLGAPEAAERTAEVIRRIEPDWILVSDDRPAMLLDIALACAPDRVVALVHTHFHLPFGPEAETHDSAQHERLRRVWGIVAVSEHSRAYLREFGGLDSVVLHFPVFGDGPFEPPEHPDSGYVTMINPCLVKGLPIFLELAALFPDTPFAAVPTWGGDAAVLRELSHLPNMTILDPADDVGAVLRDTRILVAPSLVPETFGYVALDAMLRSIPVLAGNLGGQPEAKLGLDFILPVAPARRTATGYAAPPQDIAPWQAALHGLLSDGETYRRCSSLSREAALRFLPKTDAGHFARYLESL
ncbi:MAG: glycosyltransferase family 4 protein [Sphingomonas sp.]|jgi:glycosyltransferase involved in cell wall biosynthesis|uniref:glycosyltransferase family 4 protein n=1 Tax=Sphingomonas sp. TaxID=28214 RepID=UPI0035673DD1